MDDTMPTDAMTDRDILREIERRLLALDKRLGFPLDDEYPGAFDIETDMVEPLNAMLVYLEEALHPNRANPLDALINAVLDSLASGVLAASLDDAIVPFVPSPTA
jgi:hypothetical protein